MNRISFPAHVVYGLLFSCLFGWTAFDSLAWSADRAAGAVSVTNGRAASAEPPDRVALQYAQAMASRHIEQWASRDVTCLSDAIEGRTDRGKPEARACWDATLAAHRALLDHDPEPGIFGAMGRETGFGLIHESHRHADFWKDYPPALAVSPVVLYTEHPTAPVPHIETARVEPSHPVGLVLKPGLDPVRVEATVVYLKVTYPDPMTAPMALRPGEPWWASPVVRRYGPVRELLARFVVVGGLRALGFPVDQAVINDAVPGAPKIVGPQIPGIVPDSPRWWEWQDDPVRFEASLQEASRFPSLQERLRRYRRLLTVDPASPRVNALYGKELYQAFLREGLKKGQIAVADQALLKPVAELYWNLQAQTWRQEFTEVAMGHSFAAEAFYNAIVAFERALKGKQVDEEMRRQLGVLYRWNNDADSALAIHEAMLASVPANDRRLRSQLLSEIAWDRIQWLSWNRRYDHPWMQRVREEAEQALEMATSPVQKLIAGKALVILEALAVPRDHARFQEEVARIKRWHDQLQGVTGLWTHLIGNDLVKSLIPEGIHVQLPGPDRSSEVMDTDVHWKVPRQDIYKTWDFDKDAQGMAPTGFVMLGSDGQGPGTWRVAVDPQAPSHPHVVAQASPCPKPDCFRLLLADTRVLELPDIVVYVRASSPEASGEAGIALAAKDATHFYALTVNASATRVRFYRVENGNVTVLGEAPAEPKPGHWHVLRAQVVNSAHVDHPRLEIYLDGREVPMDNTDFIRGSGRIGLVTKGDIVAQFDRLRLIEMVTNRPLSSPAAY